MVGTIWTVSMAVLQDEIKKIGLASVVRKIGLHIRPGNWTLGYTKQKVGCYRCNCRNPS